MKLLPVALVALAGHIACAPSPSSNDVFVIAPDAQGNYGLVRRPLPVRDVRTLDNDVFAFEAHSKLESSYTSVSVSEPGEVDLALIERDGAWTAGDYESLLSLSAAHHLFAAREHFADLGIESIAPPLPKFRVVLFPYRESSTLPLVALPVDDNAYFAATLGGFAILHESNLDSLPLAANLGVLAHELSHAAFSHLVRRTPEGEGIEVLFRGLNEGLADVHGSAVSNDPRFVNRSVPRLGGSRDTSVTRAYTPAEADANAANPYWYGSVVASTFWAYRQALIDSRGVPPGEASRRMSRAALMGVASYVLPTPKEGKATTLAMLERPFWAGFVAEAKATGDDDLFCASVAEHFAELPDLVGGACP